MKEQYNLKKEAFLLPNYCLFICQLFLAPNGLKASRHFLFQISAKF